MCIRDSLPPSSSSSPHYPAVLFQGRSFSSFVEFRPGQFSSVQFVQFEWPSARTVQFSPVQFRSCVASSFSSSGHR
eukprot:7744878-Pyramimonas_sp.AAC.1